MIRRVAIEEFRLTVKRKGYLVFALGMPLFCAGYLAVLSVISLAGANAGAKVLLKPVGIVDRSELLTGLRGPLADVVDGETYEFAYREQAAAAEDTRPFDSSGIRISKTNLRRFDRFEAAKEALLAGGIRALIVIPEDYAQRGTYEKYVSTQNPLDMLSDLGDQYMRPLMSRGMLSGAGLPPELIEALEAEPGGRHYEYDPATEQFVEPDMSAKFYSTLLPMVVAFFLVVGVSLTNRYILSSTAADKECSVTEILLSSVSADELLYGKLLGQMAAGLLALVIWVLMINSKTLITALLASSPASPQVDVFAIVMSGAFVVLGCLFYGSLIAGLASLSSTQEESLSLTWPIRLCITLPLLVMIMHLGAPNAPLIRLISFVPFFAPTTMILRLGLSDVAMTDVWLSVTLMVFSIWLSVRLSARMFRLGALRTGRCPRWSEILHIMRQG